MQALLDLAARQAPRVRHLGPGGRPDALSTRPRALALLVLRDAEHGSTVLRGQRPADWLPALVRSGRVPRAIAIEICAGLLERTEAYAVAEGARLAASLGGAYLGARVLHALEQGDTALLLQVDRGGRSVEDALLASAVAIADLSDDGVRGGLLECLRFAARPHLEARVLCSAGTPDEVARWVPALLEEPLDPATLALLGARARRDDEVGRALRPLLAEALPPLP